MPTRHIDGIGRLVAQTRPSVIISLGDWYDLPSLSSYDRGKRAAEGARVIDDIAAGNKALERLEKHFPRGYRPRKVYLLGNHEHRLQRYIDDYPALDGILGYHLLSFHGRGWEMYDYLDSVVVNGVSYCHMFPRGASGSITQTRYGAPSARAQIQRELQSCTAGHRQGLDFAVHSTNRRTVYSIIAGSCYLHAERYLGPGGPRRNGNNHWRGVILKTSVHSGQYDPRFISLSALC